MKKLFAFISVLAVAAAGLFAEVTAKKLADGKIEATFFYGNPRATEVLVAGDFTNWQTGALPMTKTEKGFTLTKVFEPGTTVKYKFISDGNWTTDLKAPDFIDDGFGGKNSVAELDAIAGGGDSAAPKAGIKFQTWSNLGLQATFDAYDKGDDGKYDGDFKPAAVGLGAKSYWKFGGSIIPHVPVYVEVALAELEPDNEGNVGYSNLYKRNSLDLGDGMKNFLTDLFFDPIYWFGGQASAKTYLGHFKSGIETGWVDWTTGYKYAKLPPHKNVNWDTVDQEWEAGYSEVGGYNQFASGAMFNEWLKNLTDGNVDLNLVFAPNRSADRAGNRYGVYSYANATLFGNHYIDVQYNGAYGTEFDKVLDEIYENDIIFGYKGSFGPLTFKGNYLLNLYGSQEVTVGGTKYKSFFNPASSDVGAVNDDVDDKQDNMAANVNLTFSNDFVTAMVGYRFRGAQANMMYIEQGSDDHDHLQDNLGYLNRQRFFADINVNPTEALSIGVVPYLETKFNKDVDSNDKNHNFKNKDTMLLVVRPKVGFKISDNMAIDGYGEVSYISEDEDKFVRGSETENFVFNEAGLKFAATFEDSPLAKLDVIYGYDGNTDEVKYAMHSLLAEAGLSNGWNLQAGVGIRTHYADVDDFDKTGVLPAGFALGTNKQICKKYSTTFIAQFLYGFNPYNDFGDKWCNFKLDDYIIDRDIITGEGKVSSLYNKAAVRVGLSFDF